MQRYGYRSWRYEAFQTGSRAIILVNFLVGTGHNENLTCGDRCLFGPRRRWAVATHVGEIVTPGGKQGNKHTAVERSLGGREGLPEQWWLLVGHVQNIHGGGITGYC